MAAPGRLLRCEMGGRKTYRFLATIIVCAVISTCGADFVAQAQPSEMACQRSVSTIGNMHSNLTFPPYFSEENPAKRGGEFDPNRSFEAFPHLRMRDRFTLDYVYHQDGMGGYPVLYARPAGQAPYVDEAAYEVAGDHPSYLKFVVPQDNPEGYFEYAAFAMMANQFYLDWHAKYNDWRPACGADDLDEIVRSLEGEGTLGRPMSAQQQNEARAIENPAPSVVLNDETATVAMVVFTKWGGFYRRTLMIDRQDHSIRDEQNLPLVEYDCGVAF